MLKYLVRLLAVLLASIFLIPKPVFSADVFDSQLEAKVIQIIKDHPEVVLESVQDYQQQQYEPQKEAQRVFLESVQADPKQFIGLSPVKGEAEGSAILFEFADFQCPYCSVAS